MEYIKVFVVGGLICAVGQILIDRTGLTPAQVSVMFVTLGVVLTAIGLYEPLVQFVSAGATVPLSGFGYTMAKGTEGAAHKHGLPDALTDGVISSATGIVTTVSFDYLVALIAKPGDKS